MMPAPKTICAECGYDLAGLTGGPCPECGRVDPASPFSPRAARWSRHKRLWLGVPIGIFSLLLLAWCLLLDPAFGFRHANAGSFVGAFAGILLGSLFVHAIAWAATSGDSEVAQLRGRLWWSTMPALHGWWLVWPVIVIVGMRVASAIGVSDLAATRAFFGLWPFVLAAVMPLPLWRLCWWVATNRLGVVVRPNLGSWVAAAVIGVQANLLFVLVGTGIAMADV